MANHATYNFTKQHFAEGAAPTTPDAGEVVVYAKTDGKLYIKDDAGTETDLTLGGSGIAQTLIDAKGDLIAGSAADTAARLAVGTNGYRIKADSAQATGLAWVADYVSISWVIDGGGSTITTGNKRGFRYFGPAGVIEEVTVGLDQSGSIVIDVWKDTQANYPPTVADTITASAKPTVTTATTSTDATLTGWTTTVSQGDWFFFNVDSVTTATWASINFKVRKT